MDALNVLKVQITAKMPVAGEQYNTAMSAAFARAADSIQSGIDQGIINEKQGLRKIKELLYKEYRVLGFSPEEAKHLRDPNNKSHDMQGKQGGIENPGTSGPINRSTTPAPHGAARGGYVGGAGRKGHDSVPFNVDGRKIITAPGEYVGVFTGRQQGVIEQATGMSMPELFERHKTPHYASKGGVWKLGERIQGMSFAGAPYNVSENSHFGGVHPVHVKNSLHYSDEALDINHDVPPGSEPAALDSLAKKLISEGWHVLWKVAGHFDHLHVDDASGGGGLPAATVKHIKRIQTNMSGGIGDLFQGVLDGARTAANTALDQAASAAGSVPGIGDLGDGSIKGGGSASENQKLAKSMMRRFGWGSDMWPALQRLGVKESNWDEKAVNKSSGAFGIGQFLGATKDAYAKYGAASTAPGGQINAMLHYIKDRYGNPRAALDFHNAHNWYYAGGTPVPPPVSGNKQPDVDPGDASPNNTHKKNKADAKAKKKAEKKKKDKKKKVVRIAGNRPELGAGTGVGAFRPKSKKPKPKPRGRIKELIAKAFGVRDPNFLDPITGEALDTDKYAPLATIANFEKVIGTNDDNLQRLVDTSGLTDEEAIVSLYDSDQYSDLTNYLKGSLGLSDAGVADWITKHGDSADVVNPNGMYVQGTFTRGISQAVQELMAQLSIHEGPMTGTMALLQRGLGMAQGIPSGMAIKERIQRLAEVKKVFEANVDLRKKYKKKLNSMGNKNYTWKQAVDHNSDLITSWRRWKRDSINEPQADTDTANHEIDRLTDLNKDLRRRKPKGTVYGSAEYNRTLSIYQGRGIENRMLVGDKDATAWAPTGGFAGDVATSLSNWRSIDSERSDMLSSYPGRIQSEQTNIDSIRASIQEWTGTKVPLAPINRDTPTDNSAAELADINKTIAMNNLRDSLLGNTQFGVLKDFASILGMKMLGAYSHGGLIPETGMALVHKGEYITPSPDGPFRNGMNAPSGGNHHFAIEVHMKDKSAALVEMVDARVRKVAPAEVSRQTGRNTRRISVAPGGRIR
jgi:hypothetical protein